MTHAGPVDTLTSRFVIAWAICFLFAKIKGVKIHWKNSLQLLPMGLCYPLGFFLFQGFGLIYATSGEAGILAATGPIFTVIIAAVFIKERYNLIQSFSILLSVAGVIYIAIKTGSSLDSIAGIALLLLSAIVGAGYAVLNRVLVRSFSTFEITESPSKAWLNLKTERSFPCKLPVCHVVRRHVQRVTSERMRFV